ncbi:phosphoenolpyruvate phosphomutase-domain-containing protein [Astrocystis sublimbata]|nr:phosphoenolpyruvate phosphomutase-domain-containing protein [Astrocystis sublimbata]
MASQQPAPTSAAHFAALHIPGKPLVVPNIWDLSSLKTVLSINSSSPIKAIATASYAIAASLGLPDASLSFGANLIRVSTLAPTIRAASLPLTVDIQDGYGPRLDDVIAAFVRVGAVGVNLEDMRDDNSLYGIEEMDARIRRVKEVAEEYGCDGFVVNARCDCLGPGMLRGSAGGTREEMEEEEERLLQETVERGKRYLDAGATTVFVWGGSARGLRDREVRTLVKAFDGRLAVKLSGKQDALSVTDLKDMGVARISVGPELYTAAMGTVGERAERIVGGGRLWG